MLYNFHVFDLIVSLLYPKKCVGCSRAGSYICDNCFSTISFLEFQVCGACQKGSIDGLTHPKCRTKYGLDGILSSISYKGIVKKLLYQFKYPPYLSSLKVELGNLLHEGLIQQESFVKFVESDNVIIISVPLHPKRERSRGYNQSALLAQELSYKTKISCFSNLLIRKINTKPQFKLKKEQRAENITGAFIVNNIFKNQLKGKRIILVDDISTTGSTLRECAKVLKRSGVEKVLGVTLAHEAQRI